MDLQSLVDTYGYLAIFVGAFLEGETILAMGGFAAQSGYLDLRMVILVALFAGFLGDEFFFFLGRYQGTRILARYPNIARRADAIDQMLARFHAPLIIGIRFMYGFRIAGPILIGMGRIPAWQFALYNFIGACLWAPLIAGLGYFFGHALAALLKSVYQYELLGLIAVAIIIATVWVILRLRARRAATIAGQKLHKSRSRP